MIPDLEEIIKYDSEGVKIDYGRKSTKFDILKDISAFANHSKTSSGKFYIRMAQFFQYPVIQLCGKLQIMFLKQGWKAKSAVRISIILGLAGKKFL